MRKIGLMAALSAASLAGPSAFAMGGLTPAERAAGRYLRDGNGHPTLTPEQKAAQLREAFDAKHNEVKGIAEKALEEAKRGIDMTGTAKELADQAITGMNEAKSRLDTAEQVIAELKANGFGQNEQQLTAGGRLIESEEFKSFTGMARPKGRIVVDVKDISSLTTDAAGSVGTLIQPTRVAAPVMVPQRRMTIRALLAQGQTNSNLIEYDREVGFTNSADFVADGALKPQSEIQFEEADARVRTIAHWMRVNVQTLADAPALRSIIDNRLRYGLAYKEETALLTGSGVGENIEGLITAATAFAAPGGLVADQLIDTIRLGMLQVALAEYPANGVVLNPIDWTYIEMLKDGTDRYLIGNPQSTLNPTLWGLPVVATQAMTVDKFLVGAFDLAAQIFDRQDATVELSTEDQDNFVKNKVTIRAEERLALAIYRPEALVYGDLGRVA